MGEKHGFSTATHHKTLRNAAPYSQQPLLHRTAEATNTQCASHPSAWRKNALPRNWAHMTGKASAGCKPEKCTKS